MLLNDLRSRGMMKQGLRGVTLLNSFNTWAGFECHFLQELKGCRFLNTITQWYCNIILIL